MLWGLRDKSSERSKSKVLRKRKTYFHLDGNISGLQTNLLFIIQFLAPFWTHASLFVGSKALSALYKKIVPTERFFNLKEMSIQKDLFFADFADVIPLMLLKFLLINLNLNYNWIILGTHFLELKWRKRFHVFYNSFNSTPLFITVASFIKHGIKEGRKTGIISSHNDTQASSQKQITL